MCRLPAITMAESDSTQTTTLICQVLSAKPDHKIDETNNQLDDDDDTSTKYDFLSRYFAPWVGIPEDPVTGSAHTVLPPYWSTKFNGQNNFVARQCSKRGGDLSLTLNDNDNKVYISGHACVVMSGKLNIV